MVGSLREALAHNFSARTRMKGDEYVARNRVQIESGSASAVHATVLGTGLYRVSITRRDNEGPATFAASCGCPYFRQEFTPCKHVWATVCLAEEKGHLGDGQAMPRRAMLLLDGVDEDYWLEEPVAHKRPP